MCKKRCDVFFAQKNSGGKTATAFISVMEPVMGFGPMAY